MPDEDKNFVGSSVLDLVIWWCHLQMLYNKYVHVNVHNLQDFWKLVFLFLIFV